ncbi:MAG: Cadherin protein [Pedosphaera sp.]|nr:Cadherin protein [Pedosphaera sp.]
MLKPAQVCRIAGNHATYRCEWYRLLSGAAFSLLLATLLLWHLPAGAEGVVTTASATELRDALLDGGLVTLAFDGTITITNTINITDANPTIIDATGHAVTITGNGKIRLFKIASGISCTMSNVALTNGKVTGTNGVAGLNGLNGVNFGGNGGNGGTGESTVGGAIWNLGDLFLVNCIISSNSVTGGNGGNGGTGGNGGSTGGNGGNGGNAGTALGGAIYNSGTVLLTNCTLAGNSTLGGNGGLGGTNGAGPSLSYVGGGGVGAVASGAGLYNVANGTITIVNCTFSQNNAHSGNSQAAGTSTSNPANGLPGPLGADSRGGGICNLGSGSITNSTFAGNFAIGGNAGNGGFGNATGGNGGNGGNAYGGGVFTAGGLQIESCTFADGAANGGTNGVSGAGPFPGSNGSKGLSRGDNISNNGGTLRLKNSILARGANLVSAYGTIQDQGYNISTDGSPVFAAGSSSRNNLTVKLDSLKDNGGPTLTMALLTNSPAINAADPGNFPPVDQRGILRSDARADIGAYEAAYFNISGQVKTGTNALATNGVGNVTIKAGGISTLTDAHGFYSFQALTPGSYIVKIQPPEFFTPTNQTVILGPTNAVNINFTNINSGTGTMSRSSSSTPIVQYSVHGIPKQTYRIVASTNVALPLTNWTTIYTTNSGTTGNFLFSQQTNSARLFFRAVTP